MNWVIRALQKQKGGMFTVIDYLLSLDIENGFVRR